ncbi:MAG: UDP-forming cellulose synthase catalytic subunit [Bauldia litoralis]
MTKIGLGLLWAVAATAALFLITLPISLQAQLIAGSLVVAAMIALKVVRPEGIWRLMALALGTAIVLRYVYWRTTQTIPPINQLENFVPGALLYGAELYNVFMLFLSLFVVARPLPSRRPPPMPDELPTVDIYVPTYNEGADLLATTLAAAKGMDYPADKFTIWLLDDGGTDQKCNSDKVEEAVVAQQRRAELQKLCEDLVVNDLTRARNAHATAGNLNNGLDHSTGELVAVFDADHAPARDFRVETVSYFSEDEKLVLVQTPHFVIIPDPLERNLRTFEKMPSENEMFYGIIQRGLDKWNASFFCGSAAVLKRTALAETNGFSGVSITEDCETALELHARGWHSVYVDKPLIAGLQPTTFASFIGQRTRWAQGMMQILRFRFPPGKRGLKLSQRLSYMSSTLFWLFPIPRIIFLVSPLFYLFFGAEIFVASGGEFAAYTLMYMIVNLMMQNYLYGRYRWPWISELYELIQSVYLLPALISVLMNPARPTFKVTAKDEKLDRNYISELGGPFYIIFAILLAGVAMTVWRLVTQPYDADVALVVGAWNIMNLLMVGCALGVVSERRNPQSSHRVVISRRCDFRYGDEVIPASIEDVSIGGARIKVLGTAIPHIDKTRSCSICFEPLSDIGETCLPLTIRSSVMEDNALIIGGRFSPANASHYRLIADLLFANSKQWSDFQESRRVNIGIIKGTLWFLKLSIIQSGRGMIYLMRRIGALREAPIPEPQAIAEEVRQ